jgi:hypothetical protein
VAIDVCLPFEHAVKFGALFNLSMKQGKTKHIMTRIPVQMLPRIYSLLATQGEINSVLGFNTFFSSKAFELAGDFTRSGKYWHFSHSRNTFIFRIKNSKHVRNLRIRIHTKKS